MPTKRLTDRERRQFDDILHATTDDEEELGYLEAQLNELFAMKYAYASPTTRRLRGQLSQRRSTAPRKKKRKLSAWNKYVKANSKKPRFRYRNGKLNLKKMAVAFRKSPAGKKRKR